MEWLLAKLETEALVSATRSSSKVKALASSHPVATHASHAAAKECLEDAVGVNIMETMATTVLNILATVIHASFLVITEDSVGLANLKYNCH